MASARLRCFGALGAGVAAVEALVLFFIARPRPYGRAVGAAAVWVGASHRAPRHDAWRSLA